ncbi:MAG: hypothetical protein ACLR6Z_00560 [Dorea sp.]
MNHNPSPSRHQRGLPAIPVTSGGNYTDADGQQWIADYVDLKRGKYVQNINTCMIDASTNVFKIGKGGFLLESTRKFFTRYL